MDNKEKILQKGAEADIILKNKIIIKKRIKKKYRIKEIDEKIRKKRTKSEGKILKKAKEIIDVPEIIKIDEKKKEIQLEFIDGLKISENLKNFSIEKQKKIFKKIGENIAKIHNQGIIHGDLTTSNMIFFEKNKNFKVYLIDFGLGFISFKIEDKAVDIHLFKKALEAKHFENFNPLQKEFFKAYYKFSCEKEKIKEQLKKVEKRGRYKH